MTDAATLPLWLGANFWSRAGGPRMWTDRYDPAVVRDELAVLAAHGLTVTRSFFFWPDFQPEPDRLDEDCVARFADFLDAHVQAGMTTIPTFIVGHMSGENWDPTWRDGRDLYRDVWFVARQAWYVRELTARFHRHPAVAGWLLSNEVPIYGGEAPHDAVAAWAQILVDAIRAVGSTLPVSTGDGAWGIETTGHDSGFRLRELAPLSQFVGPHVYRMEADVIRQHLKAAWVAQLCGIAGLPVVLEEFGVTDAYVSAANAAVYYRQQLHNTLVAGVRGWIAWNNTDFDDLVAERPYSHHPFEMHFGITDATGAPKPALKELELFAADLAAMDAAGLRRAPADTALVIPSHLAEGYPFSRESEREHIVAVGEQAYAATREAHLPVTVERESADGGVAPGYRLYLLPSVKQLCGPTWRQLVTLTDDGAVVYASYCAGEAPAQRGPWWAFTEELFGVTVGTSYGLVEPIEDDVVTIEMTAGLGALRAGDRLRFRASGTPDARAYLPVDVTAGDVLAVDGHGRPALVGRRHGAGYAVLCTYPLEYLAARCARVNPEDTWRLYDALAALAGADRPLTVEDPRVFADTVAHADGRRFAVFASQHPDAADVTPVVASGALHHLDGTPDPVVALGPYGTAVREIR
ncbi:cellulase family glycosylhydrolase [Microbacterium sp. SYP-A9085]|uniref:glycoside hydrolase 5 family protein n=1 Tax=Microbacterium sp. SYP-A9085 TaxID=2664454 RepID=UPI00129AA965|nr:cellulase family glycosylhydrolase [Microbacterium sp. SYP-A9085]MRH28066.1 cellulase family glycosylhydrolase [Microbacterium sp. SYP-A9085]